MGRFNLGKPAAAPAPETPAADPAPRVEPTPKKAAPTAQSRELDVRLKLHSQLIDELDLSKLDKLSETELRREVLRSVTDFARVERMALNTAELEELGASIYDEMVGLGPIEPLLKDETINDILINGPFQVYVERRGELELTAVRFRDNDHLLRIVNRIVAAMGMAPNSTSFSRVRGFLENLRIDTEAPSMAMGAMAAFTRLPSGRRASTMGWLSSIRRPTAATMRFTIRNR